jgi:hypothetical protein
MANGDLEVHLSGLGIIEILSKEYFKFQLIKYYPPQRLFFFLKKNLELENFSYVDI